MSSPLEALFPDAGVADLGRLRRSADEIDDVQVSGKPQVWEWFPQHVTFRGRAKAGTPELLLAVGSLYNDGADWLELSLDVEWTKEGLLNVWSAISMACWYEVTNISDDHVKVHFRMNIDEDGWPPASVARLWAVDLGDGTVRLDLPCRRRGCRGRRTWRSRRPWRWP